MTTARQSQLLLLRQNPIQPFIFIYFSLCLRFLWFRNAFLVRQNLVQMSQQYPGVSTWDASMCSYMFVFTFDVFRQSQHCHNPSSVFLIFEQITVSRSKAFGLKKFIQAHFNTTLDFCYTEINGFFLGYMVVLFHVTDNVLF